MKSYSTSTSDCSKYTEWFIICCILSSPDQKNCENGQVFNTNQSFLEIFMWQSNNSHIKNILLNKSKLYPSSKNKKSTSYRETLNRIMVNRAGKRTWK